MAAQRKLVAAALQMTSTPTSISENIATVRRLIQKATATHNASVIVLPEYWATLGMKQVHTIAEPLASAVASDEDKGTPIQNAMASLAKEFNVTLIGGTIPTQSTLAAAKNTPSHEKFHNSLLVYNTLGARIADYNKIHLFKFEGPPAFDEGVTVDGGSSIPVTCSVADGWDVRLSVCYDMRFPELYRQGSGDFNVIVVPAAFTVETGKAHWECLLRARAIENQAYVIASAQVGIHPVTNRATYGHSMIIDPWGRVVSEVVEDVEGLAVWEMDLDVVADVRHRLPALQHRRL
ncbi:nitrilase [Obelidium mucronatum]|nr:nitrilase [Obelidium mucronatum]